jgi:hypothetical protein
MPQEDVDGQGNAQLVPRKTLFLNYREKKEVTFKLGLLSQQYISSGRSPSGPDGQDRLQDRLSTPHPLETDRRLPLLAARTWSVSGDQLVQALALDEVPVLGTDLVRDVVGLVADQQLDGEGFVRLACPPVGAGADVHKVLNEHDEVIWHLALLLKFHVYSRGKSLKILMRRRNHSI